MMKGKIKNSSDKILEKILRTTEKFIPKKLYKMGQPIYHWLLSTAGAILYGFPGKNKGLYIIGVTGTKGKSTVTEIINAILEEAGHKTALANSIRFKIDDETSPNKYKMSMPGRFFVANFLKRALKSNCSHVVLEITSEGSKQFRNKYIDLDAFVFTNLAPEHIESHGSYEKYREAKLRILDGLKQGGLMILNSDDEESDEFSNRPSSDKKISKATYSLSDAKPIEFEPKTKFRFKKSTLYSDLAGEFNVYNILAAATLADQMGIDIEIIRNAVEGLTEIPGRVQKVQVSDKFARENPDAASRAGQIDVIIDYAHTAESLEELYKAFSKDFYKIAILGNTGGGRDQWKRPVMAKVAEKYCDKIILANEDPYDEDPIKIVTEMHDAIDNKDKVKVILDRREAISSAILTALEMNSTKELHGKEKVVVLISGKGTDPYLMEANGKKTPWSDYSVAREELERNSKRAE
jgi:UDP-N-acetylmuramoyl-L-alanyl-D-glutamate--2,6-diaminopimelate ligase